MCVTKFCSFCWLDYSVVFGSQEYRLTPRRPLGKLITQPFPINGFGEFSEASSHESLARNCLPPPRKDSFLREGYSVDSDGGRDPTCSGSNIRKSQTISATQRDSYTKRFFFFFKGPTVDPPVLKSQVITSHRRWVVRSAFKKRRNIPAHCLH